MTTLGSVTTLQRKIAAGEIGVTAALEPFLRQLERIDDRVGGLLESFPDQAMKCAREADQRLAGGAPARALEGVPFTAKGNICTRVGSTNAGSQLLRGFRSPYDATAVARLLEAGAILVGKTNLDEFGMGSSCENSSFQPTRNPWDLERVPGGSSGGAAALAGALGASFHLGSDTGGSIRQPAALCGATGFKPTYGAVSRYGLLAFGSSLDQIGPLARTAEDCELIVRVMSGADPFDATSLSEPLETSTGQRRLGIPREYFVDSIDAEVRERVLAGIQTLEQLGYEVREVSLPHTEYANACYQVISTAEASSNLARYDGVHYGVRAEAASATADSTPLTALYRESRGQGFGAEVRRRVLLGTFVLSAGHCEAYYQRALRVRTRIREDFERVFEEVDALVCPTSPIPPFRLGERVTDPLALYACDILTVSANLAGIPGVSIPCGSDEDGLPVGLQILGPAGGDLGVLAIAQEFQSETSHHELLPDWVRGEQP